MAAVEGRSLVPVPRHGRESRRRPSWRGVPAPSSPDLCLGCAARPGRCALEAGSAPGPGHCLRGVFSGEATARGDRAGRPEAARDTTRAVQATTSPLIPFPFPFIRCGCWKA